MQIVSLYDVQAERQPIQPIFAMAARFFAALCLADQGKARDAADYLAKYPSMPGDAYGGDAHLLLGELAFAAGDPQGAITQLNACRDATTAAASSKAPISDAMRKLAAPDTPMKVKSKWGNQEWFKESPDQLYNPQICTWYVGYMRLRACEDAALANFALGHAAAAVADLEPLKGLDPEDAALAAARHVARPKPPARRLPQR